MYKVPNINVKHSAATAPGVSQEGPSTHNSTKDSHGPTAFQLLQKETALTKSHILILSAEVEKHICVCTHACRHMCTRTHRCMWWNLEKQQQPNKSNNKNPPSNCTELPTAALIYGTVRATHKPLETNSSKHAPQRRFQNNSMAKTVIEIIGENQRYLGICFFPLLLNYHPLNFLLFHGRTQGTATWLHSLLESDFLIKI